MIKEAPLEINRLAKIQSLLEKDELISVSEIEQAMEHLTSKQDWEKLINLARLIEIRRLQKIQPRLDKKNAVLTGEVWRVSDGSLDSTWPGADDGKKPGLDALPMLFVVDEYSGALKHHSLLMVAVEKMLGVTLEPEFESERDRFLDNVSYWEKLAGQHLEPTELLNATPSEKEGSKTVLSRVDNYEEEVEAYLMREEIADGTRRNKKAHNLSIKLSEQCRFIRELIPEGNTDPENWFFVLNAAVNAKDIASRLEVVSQKGRVERTVKFLARKGNSEVSFTEAVREACAQCYIENPTMKLTPKRVLEAMNGRVVEFNFESYISPLAPDKSTWTISSVKKFNSAKSAWCTEMQLPTLGSRKPGKEDALPSPEEIVSSLV